VTENPSERSILIVDDVEETRTILDIIFREEGFIIYEAADGIEAWDMVQKYNPDICLLDINLPGMDGVEVLGKIQETNPLTYVVMITAYADISNVMHALKRGAKDFILKPFDYEKLVEVVHRLLRKRDDELITLSTSYMFEAVMQDLVIGVVIVGDDGKVEWLNHNAQQIMDASHKDEIKEKINFIQWFPFKEANLTDIFLKALSGEFSATITSRFPTLKGNSIPARIWTSARYNELGKQAGFVFLIDGQKPKR
jgi:DNA-binding response OmpR family regulator